MDLEKIKTKLKNNYYIKEIYNNNGLIIFSKEKYNKDEKKLFDKYILNNKQLKNFNIENEPHSRYLYIEEISDNKLKRIGNITFVMLNPSYTNEIYSDPTLYKVRKRASIIKHQNGVGYKYFTIINLFSYRHHKPSELKNIIFNNKNIKTNYNEIDNLEFIKNYLNINKDDKDFIIAFGNSKIFKDKKVELLNLLKQQNKNLITFYPNGKPYHINCGKKVYDNNKQLHLYPLKYPI